MWSLRRCAMIGGQPPRLQGVRELSNFQNNPIAKFCWSGPPLSDKLDLPSSTARRPGTPA
jgi:hypothetical protein